ncbi:hypothetical protein [Neobacillus cucumis]|uniref:hypothetical protein n=1 Tax=Neobacillus cucumis TaxID=1740721 RepID=UPI002E1FC554|nr:hypothetical protein [Neobacillus cucumis]
MNEISIQKISDEEIEHNIFQFIHGTLYSQQSKMISKGIYQLHRQLLRKNVTKVRIQFTSFLKLIHEKPLH